MPTSWYQAVPNILDNVQMEMPQSILDIGIGFGKYGLLLREIVDVAYERYFPEEWIIKIDGVEAFSNYINPVHKHIYDNVLQGDIAHVIHNVQNYDVILLIDVLEHFSKNEGKKLIKNILLRTNKALIISTPIYPEPQEEYQGNKFEEHKSRWYLTDFLEFDFTYQEVKIGDNGANIFKLYPKNKERNPISIKKNDNSSLELPSSFTIAYYLPHTNLTGGLKMLLQQMFYLKKRGHKVIAVIKGNQDQKAIPDWSNFGEFDEIIVPEHESVTSYLNNVDIIVAGWINQLTELENKKIPVFYWEQGHEWLFGDIVNITQEKQIRNMLYNNYRKDVKIASVSPIVSNIIQTKYNRETIVLPNFIDTNFYYPSIEYTEKDVPSILIMGNPSLRFKGMDVSLKVLELVWNLGYKFKVKWVSQIPITANMIYPLEVIISPSQENLADIYRESEIFLSTSWYEGFSMPPLEAMSSGVAVVSTLSGGVQTFATHYENSLLFEPGDIEGLATGIIYLIKNPEVRKQLSQKGRKTAEVFDYTIGISFIEELLQKTYLEYKTQIVNNFNE